MARDDVWTEKQITIVLYEYCRRPFGQFSGTKPFLKELGELINSISYRITPNAKAEILDYLHGYDFFLQLSTPSRLRDVIRAINASYFI